MFDNIGQKIKTLAQVVCYIGMALFILIGLGIMVSDDPLNGLLIGGLGALGSWVGSFALYGFGQLIENTDKLVLLSKRANEVQTPPQDTAPAQPAVSVVEQQTACCPHCQGKITVPEDAVVGFCPWCGKKLSF